MTQRAKRRQRWRKYAAKQKQAVSGQNCPTGGIRFPRSGSEMLKQLSAAMSAFSEVEVPPLTRNFNLREFQFHSSNSAFELKLISLEEIDEEPPRRLVDTGHLRQTPPLHPNVRSDISWQIIFDDPKPTTRPNPCNGCRNYHGQAYGGNLLICGIHPYGVEGDECPDRDTSNLPQPSHTPVIDIRTFGD